MTLTPDLVFESMAVGDVKYKIAEEWLRSDLYQAVTFAEGFETKSDALSVLQQSKAIHSPQ